MIRSTLRALAAPLLGHIGVTLLHVARDAEDRADAAERNLDIERGRKIEAREYFDDERVISLGLRDDLSDANNQIERMTREIDTLRSEAASAAVDDEVYQSTAQALEETKAERDALTVRLADMTEARDTWKDEDRKQRERIRESSNAHATEVNALRARVRELETQLDARADAAPVKDAGQAALSTLFASSSTQVHKCGWCLGDVEDPDAYGVALIDSCGNDALWVNLCRAHGKPVEPTAAQVRARVALRARCHPARLTADPTADQCLTCGAPPGEECRDMTVDVDVF